MSVRWRVLARSVKHPTSQSSQMLEPHPGTPIVSVLGSTHLILLGNGTGIRSGNQLSCILAAPGVALLSDESLQMVEQG